MSLRVIFDFGKSRRIFDCLMNGESITGILTADDLLMLAGVCLLGITLQNRPQMKFMEHAEAMHEQLVKDTHAAINFFAKLSALAQEPEKYAEKFDPIVGAEISQEADGNQLVLPDAGWKTDVL
jgi:hypothetical protein